jgi:23S rRNA (uracil1939-C5)-methyltransferase
VLDLYCGLGNFSLPIARWVAEVCAVEGDGGLVARAAKNAELNGINNSRFFTADLAQSDWSFFREQWDVVVLDPARTGAETAVASMARMAPRRIVYVSCHPGTLARDAAVLVGEQGYLLKSAQVLDMFPHTHHVETIAVFDKVA